MRQTPAPHQAVIYRAVALARQIMRENAEMSPRMAACMASVPSGLDAYWQARVVELVTAAEDGCAAARARLSRR